MEAETAIDAIEMEPIELAAPPVEESPLDFDFNLGLEDEAPASSEVKEAAAPDLDLSGISLEMDDTPFAKAAPAGLPVEDFGGGQEVSTKLDLAKAYADMGDKEGAREILQEVLKEGSPEQQEEARTLIAEMG
jgi:pilus assembly protein FimV